MDQPAKIPSGFLCLLGLAWVLSSKKPCKEIWFSQQVSGPNLLSSVNLEWSGFDFIQDGVGFFSGVHVLTEWKRNNH